MYRIHQIKLNINESKEKIPEKILRKISVKDCKIAEWNIVKESLDCRDKSNIKWVYSVDFKPVSIKNPRKALRLKSDNKLSLEIAPDMEYHPPIHGVKPMKNPPVIVGFGPCGMMAALVLAQEGYRPIVIERGQRVEDRVKTLKEFEETHALNPNSNIQFGEGGAGTFSDGKLTTGIKDKRIRKVLKEFVNHGAKEEILYKQKPHVGTDVLRRVVRGIREDIISLGGKVMFDTMFYDYEVNEEGLSAIWTIDVKTGEKQRIETENLILAIGHSSRDTFRMLKEKDVHMEQKPFSMGFRIEHPQDMIDIAQYGKPARELGLPVAEYKLSYRCENGRGVYTFCMCPGGHVICAASAEGMTLTNGMSYSGRDSGVANSALLCDVRTSDFPSEDVLAGVEFQEKYEKLAFVNGGGDYSMPQTTLGDFCQRSEKALPLINSLPDFVTEAIIEGTREMGRKLKGFDDPSSKVIGVESRSSSPVRIIRDENFTSSVMGIYPGGEGAGYAGGITSAACDGIKIAEQIIGQYEAW